MFVTIFRQEGKSPIEHGELTESSHAHPPHACLHLADRAEANLGYFSELRVETISKGRWNRTPPLICIETMVGRHLTLFVIDAECRDSGQWVS